MMTAARPDRSDTESRALEEFLTDYGDMFDMKSDGYLRTDGVLQYRYARGQTDWPKPEKLPPSETSGSGRDAPGHEMTWG
jgi:hypothetical protein